MKLFRSFFYKVASYFRPSVRIDYNFHENELTIENTGAKVSFPYEIGRVLTYQNTLIVLINPPVLCCTNLFGVHINGSIVWKIKYVQPWSFSIFNEIALKDENLIAYNKNGYTYYIEPMTGRIMYRENTENTNHSCSGNELTIKNTGVKVSFPSEIDEVVTYKSIFIVLIEGSAKNIVCNENVFGVHENGNIIWQIENVGSRYSRPFVGIFLKNGILEASNVNDYLYYIEPMTGKIIGREFCP